MVGKLLFVSALFILTVTFSCNNNAEELTSRQVDLIRDSVQKMAESIANDVSTEGPIAWVKYFEDVPDFFMASDGKLQFPTGDSAQKFIKNTLVKNISNIRLKWSSIRIEPYTLKLANLACDFHEDITDFNGKTISEDGYFTGIAEETLQGWKLRNAHWSSISR